MRQNGHSGPSAPATTPLSPEARVAVFTLSCADQAEVTRMTLSRSTAPVLQSWSDCPFIDLVGLPIKDWVRLEYVLGAR